MFRFSCSCFLSLCCSNPSRSLQLSQPIFDGISRISSLKGGNLPNSFPRPPFPSQPRLVCVSVKIVVIKWDFTSSLISRRCVHEDSEVTELNITDGSELLNEHGEMGPEAFEAAVRRQVD
jgi:hypothetical protein